MAQTLTSYDNVLKDFYEDPTRETLNNEVPLLRELDEGDRPWSGRRVVFPVHTTRNSGVGARSDGGTLPTAGQQGYALSVISSTYQYMRIQLTGPTIAAGKNAFAEALASEMERGVQDLKNDLGRQTWGDGTGRLAQVATDAASATSVSIFNRFAEPGQNGLRYVSPGQSLDFGDVADPDSDGSSQTVISVSISETPATTTDTLTISNSALDLSSSDTFLFVAGAGGTGLELNGVRGLVDVFTESNMWGSNAFAGSAIQGINRASVSNWNAQVLGNSQTERLVDGNLMQKAFNRIDIESGMPVNKIMGFHDTVAAFLDHVSADRRYAGGGSGGNFDAGYQALSYNGVPLVVDRQAPYNELLVCNTEALKIYTLLDWEWASDDGSILSRVSNQDAWEAFMRAYKQMALDSNPKAALVIRDIKVDL